jgi:predicted RNase H-like HicB family nuclease
MMRKAEFTLELECHRSPDGRWTAECMTLPGVWAAGATEEVALRKAVAVGLRVIAEMVAKGDPHWTRFA